MLMCVLTAQEGDGLDAIAIIVACMQLDWDRDDVADRAISC